MMDNTPNTPAELARLCGFDVEVVYCTNTGYTEAKKLGCRIHLTHSYAGDEKGTRTKKSPGGKKLSQPQPPKPQKQNWQKHK